MTHYLRRMLNIQRLAGTPKHRSYDLAQHSYFTTLLFLDLCKAIGQAPTVEQLDLVLKHDLLEVFTADLPYPIKNLNDATRGAWEQIEEEAVKSIGATLPIAPYTDAAIKAGLGDLWPVFKAADMLELWMFCTEEQIMGNSTVQIESVIAKCEEVLQQSPSAVAGAVLDQMRALLLAGRPDSQLPHVEFNTPEETK